MTRYFCDKCGKEIDIDLNLIALNFNGFSIASEGLKAKTGGKMPEYQLCVDCAYDVHRFANQKRKDGDGDG